MDRFDTDDSFSSYLSELRALAEEERGVPAAVAETARSAAWRALASEPDSAVLRRRASAYFWKVVRRSCMGHPAAREIRGRFVLAAVVADLCQVGWEPRRVWEEIERGWADKVPEVVLEEYRQRLCA